MAATALADMDFVPAHFNQYVLEESIRLNAFFQSGVAVDLSPVLGADKLGGNTVDMPFFQDLTGDDEVISDTADLTINNITTAQDTAVGLMRAKVFGATDLAEALSGADPMQAILNYVAGYWAHRYQVALISALGGAMGAATMASNVLDISALTGGAEFFDADSFLDAIHLLGDHNTLLSAVAVHSDTEKAMKKADLIDYVRPSEGGMPIPFYMGKRVIVDDAMPVTGVGADRVFTTYIFGLGAVGYASKGLPNPAEVGRDPLKNGGQSYLVNRRWFVMHPRGIRWTPGVGVPAGPSPSNAELAAGANWTRVYEPKNVRVVAFRHKLAP